MYHYCEIKTHKTKTKLACLDSKLLQNLLALKINVIQELCLRLFSNSLGHQLKNKMCSIILLSFFTKKNKWLQIHITIFKMGHIDIVCCIAMNVKILWSFQIFKIKHQKICWDSEIFQPSSLDRNLESLVLWILKGFLSLTQNVSFGSSRYCSRQ